MTRLQGASLKAKTLRSQTQERTARRSPALQLRQVYKRQLLQPRFITFRQLASHLETGDGEMLMKDLNKAVRAEVTTVE